MTLLAPPFVVVVVVAAAAAAPVAFLFFLCAISASLDCPCLPSIPAGN